MVDNCSYPEDEIQNRMDFNKYKANVVRHELGHWFVARSLGFDVGEIRIKIRHELRVPLFHTASSHINLHPSLQTLEETSDFLMKRMSVLWAGIVFQSSLDKRPVEDIRDTDAAIDYANIQELAFVVRGIRFPNDNVPSKELDQRQSIYDECWRTASAIIDANFLMLERLSTKVSELVRKPNIPYAITTLELANVMAVGGVS